MQRRTIKHCRECGAAVEYRTPDGDTRERAVCPACGTVHYVNPLVVVGTVPYIDDRVLLCKRAIEPRLGYWTLPAGFMENDETTSDAAERETVEEAGANIELGPLFSLLNVQRVHQVHLFYLARLRDLDFAPGIESLEVQLFTEAQIPWDDLAFPTIRATLELFFADRVKIREGGSYGFHTGDITRPMARPDADADHTA